MSAEYFSRIRRIHLFQGVDDATLQSIVASFEPLHFAAGETIFTEGGSSDFFYIIYRGKVELTRQKNKKDAWIATLEEGDYFGELAILAGRRRNATATAKTAATLLRLGAKEFKQLVARHPQVRINLDVAVQTRMLVRDRRFGWISEGEVVYLITRHHGLRLAQMMMLPVLLSTGALALGIILALRDNPAAWWIAGPGVALGLVWCLWSYVDWSNDYYVLTNRRIISFEKIVGLYDSRNEAPLWSVRSVKVDTYATGRALAFGNVTVQTISGPIVFENVPQPQAMADLVQEHWDRLRTRQSAGDQQALRETIQSRIFPGAPSPAGPAPAVTTAAATAGQSARRQAGLVSPFSVRVADGDSIVFRKHIFVLLRSIAWPSVALLFLLGLMTVTAKTYGLAGAGGVLCGAGLLASAALGWWWYEFEDWANDIYQITQNQIVDRVKKPLGAESRKVAPLDNILSARLEQTGIWALVFNYGNVIIQTGGTAGELRFENVFDPAGVQQDVYRRLEEFQASRARAESQRRREEAAEWISAYHQVVTENDRQIKGTGGGGAS